jgi:hypothetical protein
MKKPRSHLSGLPVIVVIFSFAPVAMNGQGSFQNLSFQCADPVPIVGSPYYPYAVTPASAFPDWTLYIGGVQPDQVFYNDEALGSASIDILGLNSQYGNPIAGPYSAVLQSGAVPVVSSFNFESASIEQTGTIPADAQYLDYDAALQVSYLSVTFDGVGLSPVALGTGVGPTGLAYTIYGAYVGNFAGDTGPLEFTENLGSVVPPDPANVEIADVQFTAEAVSEENTVGLMAVGGNPVAAVHF